LTEKGLAGMICLVEALAADSASEVDLQLRLEMTGKVQSVGIVVDQLGSGEVETVVHLM